MRLSSDRRIFFCRPVFPTLKVALGSARASCSAHPTGSNPEEALTVNLQSESELDDIDLIAKCFFRHIGDEAMMCEEYGLEM